MSDKVITRFVCPGEKKFLDRDRAFLSHVRELRKIRIAPRKNVKLSGQPAVASRTSKKKVTSGRVSAALAMIASRPDVADKLKLLSPEQRKLLGL